MTDVTTLVEKLLKTDVSGTVKKSVVTKKTVTKQTQIPQQKKLQNQPKRSQLKP